MTSFEPLIDEVARQMATDAAPPDDLTARTMARIDAHRRHRLWWGLAPLGAAVPALLIVSTVVVQHLNTLTLPGVPPLAHVAPLTFSVPSLDAGEPVVAEAPRTVVAAPSSEALAWEARRLPALPVPASIEPETIQPEPLAMPLLEVKPLVTTPLALEPLDAGR